MNIETAQRLLDSYEDALDVKERLRVEFETALSLPYDAITAQVEALQAQIDALNISVQPEVDAISAQYAVRLDAADSALTNAETHVRTAVMALQASVKGAHLHAVYSRGRETWDGKGLTGYAVAHPEVNAFKKTGEPSVSIRATK